MFYLFRGGDTRRVDRHMINPIFTPDPVLLEIWRCVRLEKNRTLILHFMNVIGIQNVDLLCGGTRRSGLIYPIVIQNIELGYVQFERIRMLISLFKRLIVQNF